ncbi:MAG: biotin transporter BioY [Acidaminococcales bacterium]|jgi:biotin transport system substrate-specific component|nr:biotin transporter BioY [Acidaminococcales bacterium]
MNTAGKLKDFIYAALFAALTISLGFVSIPVPFSPVPISGISLGIMLSGSMLSVRQAVNSVLALILMGAVGLPVFSGFAGGLGVLLGPRGGYYLGFMAGAGVIAFLRGSNAGLARFFLVNTLGGILIVYLFAVPWLAFVTGMDFCQALAAGALPFIIGDLLKAAVASMLAVAVRKHADRFQTAK